MKTVKVFTYLDRETSPFLPLWIKYYTENIKADLTILRRNAHLGNLKLSTDIEVIEIDHLLDNFQSGERVVPSSIFNEYQKESLQSYDVVIYCDLDEFIVHENLDEVVRSDFSTCLVTTGVEIVQRHSIDPDFNFKESVISQRNYMVKSTWYDKPLIVSSPITWELGKHNHNTFNNYVEGLYLVHLGRICLNTHLTLNQESINMYPSSTYLEKFDKDWYIQNFNNPFHTEQPMVEIPDNVKTLLSKIL